MRLQPTLPPKGVLQAYVKKPRVIKEINFIKIAILDQAIGLNFGTINAKILGIIRQPMYLKKKDPTLIPVILIIAY